MKAKQHQNYEEKYERKFSSLRFPPKPIPKHVLSRTIKIVSDSNDKFWLNKNSSCAPPVNYELHNHSDAYKKLNLARRCILGRDWHNLAKLLTTNLVGDSLIQKSSYPVFSQVSKYYSFKIKYKNN
ncbi:PREDICTED: uncharacterized protein LOC108609694 [Drosophila arizonae]|uniref:Uncharacterized protein LOC108609694 n=1 Tax=Drosophila arizonae TaxID=7263 RepID=A0ABM1NPL9_DROAR|nr:PREDICTED: uncharacterized protein LOC108609694 [Drosophila arizonae]